MNKCKDCYYFDDVTVKCCDFYHDPADENNNACLHFEFKDEDDSTEFDK